MGDSDISHTPITKIPPFLKSNKTLKSAISFDVDRNAVTIPFSFMIRGSKTKTHITTSFEFFFINWGLKWLALCIPFALELGFIQGL